MATATTEFQPRVAAGTLAIRGELALALQEAFTVAVRLRAGRNVAADAGSFRTHIKQLVSAADQRARSAGYDGSNVKLAVYAYIALLDESVLHSAQPMFADWARQPLQEEVFGEHMAGENFFRTLQDLLGRQDSDALADVLEVFLLCLLLGFRGRYGTSDPAALQALIATVQQKVHRIRGGVPAELTPDWQRPTQETIVLGRDPWLRRLTIAAAAAFGFALLLFILFRVLLGSRVGQLQSLI
jgi:type VI secretion system protein ImpK